MGWDGSHNARDLGGSPTRDGRWTRHGAFHRSALLELVTPRGWRQAHRDGVRTIVDLRNDDEAGPPSADPVGMTRVRVPLDGVEDTELWASLRGQQLDGTPLCFTPCLARRPDRVAVVLTALARTDPGGVVFHCSAGRDRTGLITLLLLAPADVEPEAIADDHALTVEPLHELSRVMGRPDEQPVIEQVLAARGTTAREVVLTTLEQLDVAVYLRDAGVAEDDLVTLRTRLAT